jgi:hypothetical protein
MRAEFALLGAYLEATEIVAVVGEEAAVVEAVFIVFLEIFLIFEVLELPPRTSLRGIARIFVIHASTKADESRHVNP